MKRRTFLALGLTAVLSIPFAMTAFADDPQYSRGKSVEFSGHTDFDYFYTYSGVPIPSATIDPIDFKCFSVVENGQRVYAAVKENLYEYYRKTFSNQDITLKGTVQDVAGDGSPVILVNYKVDRNEKGSRVTLIGECVAPSMYDENATPDFHLIYKLIDDSVAASVAEDGSYLTIDTNPFDFKNGSSLYKEVGLSYVRIMNSALGLPGWIYEEMLNTRALDGKQKEAFEKVTVTWTYSPSQGLEVIYRKNVK
nr:MAG TPA: hypothetical protein [Caudoviricetes sp.]